MRLYTLCGLFSSAHHHARTAVRSQYLKHGKHILQSGLHSLSYFHACAALCEFRPQPQVCIRAHHTQQRHAQQRCNVGASCLLPRHSTHQQLLQLQRKHQQHKHRDITLPPPTSLASAAACAVPGADHVPLRALSWRFGRGGRGHDGWCEARSNCGYPASHWAVTFREAAPSFSR